MHGAGDPPPRDTRTHGPGRDHTAAPTGTHPLSPALTRSGAQEPPDAPPPVRMPPTPADRTPEPSRAATVASGPGARPAETWSPSRPGTGARRGGVWVGRGRGSAARAQEGLRPPHGAQRGRPPGSKFKAPGGRRCALSAPPQRPFSASWRAALGPGQGATGAAATPARHGPSGRPLPSPGFSEGCALGGRAPRAAPSGLPPGQGGGGGLAWGGPSLGSPALPVNSAAPARGPPTWGPPLRPARQLRPRPDGGVATAGGGPAAAGRGAPRNEPLPQAAPTPRPPRPYNFRPEPTHHPKNSPGENESGGGDVPWRCCEEARPAPERARSVPGEGGPEAAGGGGEGGRAGEGASARGRGRAAPAPPARRTLPSARPPPALRAASASGGSASRPRRRLHPRPGPRRAGRANGRGGGSRGPGWAGLGGSGSTFAAARAPSPTHARTQTASDTGGPGLLHPDADARHGGERTRTLAPPVPQTHTG